MPRPDWLRGAAAGNLASVPKTVAIGFAHRVRGETIPHHFASAATADALYTALAHVAVASNGSTAPTLRQGDP